MKRCMKPKFAPEFASPSRYSPKELSASCCDTSPEYLTQEKIDALLRVSEYLPFRFCSKQYNVVGQPQPTRPQFLLCRRREIQKHRKFTRPTLSSITKCIHGSRDYMYSVRGMYSFRPRSWSLVRHHRGEHPEKSKLIYKRSLNFKKRSSDEVESNTRSLNEE